MKFEDTLLDAGDLVAFVADIKGLRAEEEVEKEFYTVDLFISYVSAHIKQLKRGLTDHSQNPIDPSVTNAHHDKPKDEWDNGHAIVTIKVQYPIHRARSFLKNVSATTALPIAAAGLMKKAVMARHRSIVAYE